VGSHREHAVHGRNRGPAVYAGTTSRSAPAEHDPSPAHDRATFRDDGPSTSGPRADILSLMATRPRILVFQPLLTAGARLDYGMLGFQCWLADQFTAVGLEGASALFANPDVTRRELLAPTPPTDDEIRQALVANAARFGVLTTFVVQDGTPYLELARLYRAQRGHPLRLLERWRFTTDADHIASMAHRLFVAMAPRLGLELRPSTWQQLFDTADPALAANYLTALGCHVSCEQGFAVDQPEVTLHAAMTAIAAGVRPAIELLPRLVTSLRTSGSARRDALRAAVEEAVRLMGVVPPAWQPMVAEFALTTPRMLN
jgi:hypothetical protein